MKYNKWNWANSRVINDKSSTIAIKDETSSHNSNKNSKTQKKKQDQKSIQPKIKKITDEKYFKEWVLFNKKCMWKN